MLWNNNPFITDGAAARHTWAPETRLWQLESQRKYHTVEQWGISFPPLDWELQFIKALLRGLLSVRFINRRFLSGFMLRLKGFTQVWLNTLSWWTDFDLPPNHFTLARSCSLPTNNTTQNVQYIQYKYIFWFSKINFQLFFSDCGLIII